VKLRLVRSRYSARAAVRDRTSACAARLQRRGLRLHLARRADGEEQSSPLRLHPSSLRTDPARTAGSAASDPYARADQQAGPARPRRGGLGPFRLRPFAACSARPVGAGPVGDATTAVDGPAGLGLPGFVGRSRAHRSSTLDATGPIDAAAGQAEETGSDRSAAAGSSTSTTCYSPAAPTSCDG
jgi:hypothetical protein